MVNGVSVGWVVGISAVLFLPPRMPVTGANMYVLFFLFFYLLPWGCGNDADKALGIMGFVWVRLLLLLR